MGFPERRATSCAKVRTKRFVLFEGGGVVAGSFATSIKVYTPRVTRGVHRSRKRADYFRPLPMVKRFGSSHMSVKACAASFSFAEEDLPNEMTSTWQPVLSRYSMSGT